MPNKPEELYAAEIKPKVQRGLQGLNGKKIMHPEGAQESGFQSSQSCLCRAGNEFCDDEAAYLLSRPFRAQGGYNTGTQGIGLRPQPWALFFWPVGPRPMSPISAR
jgi:hypothetical protein